MPNYDYVCEKCGHEFEVFQQMSAAPLKSCPACKKRSVKRLIGGGAGLIFKGTGFYITDYKNKASAGSGEKASTGGEGGAKSDAKPAAPKTEGKAPKAEAKV